MSTTPSDDQHDDLPPRDYSAPQGFGGQPGYAGSQPGWAGTQPGWAGGPQGFPGQGFPGQGQPGGPWAQQDPDAKSRMAAGLLGIFLGSLGIHRFYLGYTGIGVVMLLITVLSFGLLSWVSGVWGLVEGILYLTDKTGSYSRDATGRPLRD